MQQVIVFGKDSYNTLGLIRSLGQNGIPVYLLLQKSSIPEYCKLSRFVVSYKKVNNVEEGICFLKEKYPTCASNKTIIIPTSDLIASELDNHFEELSDYYIFPNSKGRLAKMMDKGLMTRLAEESGLSVPQTINYSCGDELPESICYPCMVKPAKSIAGSKDEMRVCRSREELKAAVSYQEKGHRLLLQQYIKKEYDLLLLGNRCPNGKVFLVGVFKKLRWFSMGNDGSYGLITTNYRQWFDRQKVEMFLEKLDYIGPFSIEFGVELGVPYFYEINLRNDGTSHYFDVTGFCNAYAWTMECLGYNIEYDGHGEYWFIDEFGDFMNVISKNISYCQWKRDKKQATVFKYRNPKDKKPMLVIRPYMLAFVTKNVVKALKNKSHK